MAADKTVKVTLVKSPIGYSERQKRTVAGLGLTRMNRSKVLKDTPEIRGMINKVSHLITVETD